MSHYVLSLSIWTLSLLVYSLYWESVALFACWLLACHNFLVWLLKTALSLVPACGVSWGFVILAPCNNFILSSPPLKTARWLFLLVRTGDPSFHRLWSLRCSSKSSFFTSQSDISVSVLSCWALAFALFFYKSELWKCSLLCHPHSLCPFCSERASPPYSTASTRGSSVSGWLCWVPNIPFLLLTRAQWYSYISQVSHSLKSLIEYQPMLTLLTFCTPQPFLFRALSIMYSHISSCIFRHLHFVI